MGNFFAARMIFQFSNSKDTFSRKTIWNPMNAIINPDVLSPKGLVSRKRVLRGVWFLFWRLRWRGASQLYFRFSIKPNVGYSQGYSGYYCCACEGCKMKRMAYLCCMSLSIGAVVCAHAGNHWLEPASVDFYRSKMRKNPQFRVSRSRCQSTCLTGTEEQEVCD